MQPSTGDSQIAVEPAEDGAIVLHVRGELDYPASASLRDVLSAQLSGVRHTRMDIDLSRVTFMDSAALGILIEVQQLASRAGVPLKVSRTSPMVGRLLHIAGVAE